MNLIQNQKNLSRNQKYNYSRICVKRKWEDSKIHEVSEQKPKELAHRMNEMQVQKTGKGIFIGDSAATSHMTSDMTGLYNLQKLSGSVMIGNGQNIRCTHKGLLDVIYPRRWVNHKRHMGNKSGSSIEP